MGADKSILMGAISLAVAGSDEVVVVRARNRAKHVSAWILRQFVARSAKKRNSGSSASEQHHVKTK